jgi:hypothetical protein
MSMPHVCKCGICGQQMNWLGLDFAKPGTDKSMFWCTKHGPIDTPGECLKCRAELETTANCGKRFALGIPCNQVAGHEGGCSWSDRAVNTKTEQSKP